MDAERKLPIAVQLLWGVDRAGSRGPRAELGVSAIVEAAVAIADAEGLEAVSMARVAERLGYSTMALYRHVPNKTVLLQLMWNAGGGELASVELAGETWRERTRSWALVQREGIERHPWLARMPIGNPPLAPNGLVVLEKGLDALAPTGLAVGERLRVLGLLSAYALADARLTAEMREAAQEAAREGVDLGFGAMLRTLVDADRFPHLHELAFSGAADEAEGYTPVDLFALDVDLVLDGVEALVARHRSA